MCRRPLLTHDIEWWNKQAPCYFVTLLCDLDWQAWRCRLEARPDHISDQMGLAHRWATISAGKDLSVAARGAIGSAASQRVSVEYSIFGDGRGYGVAVKTPTQARSQSILVNQSQVASHLHLQWHLHFHSHPRSHSRWRAPDYQTLS